MPGVFKSFKLTKPNIYWSPDWIKASTYYEFYTSLLITTIWNRINNGLLFCTRHTGTLYQSKNNSDWSILPSKDPETSFKSKLNSFIYIYIDLFIMAYFYGFQAMIRVIFYYRVYAIKMSILTEWLSAVFILTFIG